MSDYDMTFDKKIVDDKVFDTIFGAEEDNHLLDLILKEDSDAFAIDERDPESIEDDLGAIGKGDGLGNDLGTEHPSTGADAPKDDSSDQKILTTDKDLDKNDQLNVSDTNGQKVEDGGMVDTDDVHASGTDEVVGNDPAPCERHLDDALDKVTDKVDGFDEAAARLLEEVEPDAALPEEQPAPVAPAPDTQPAAAPVPAEEVPAAPAAEVPAPVAPASDAGVPSDMDLLDTDPVDDGPIDAPVEAADEKESSNVEDLDKEEPEDVEEACCGSKDDSKKDEKKEVKEACEPVDTDEVKDKVDFSGVEDKSGKIGAGDGLGNDVGPDHDTCNKPKDDTSDEEILPKDDIELKKDQLNTSDEAGANKVEDGGMVKDFANAGEDGKAASDSFGEASIEDLEQMSEDEEDEIIDAVEDNDAKSEFTASELNADEDDELLDMLD